MCSLQGTYYLERNIQIKSKWIEKIYHTTTNQKEAKVAILISDRGDVKGRKVIRDEEGYYVMIKGLILQEDITIHNVYVPNSTASKYVRQNRHIARKIEESSIIVGDFNIPVLQMERFSRQKINRDLVEPTTPSINWL